MALFDKVSGTASSVTSLTLTDTTKTWRENQFKDWFVTISSTEFLIVSNTTDTLTLIGSTLTGTPTYEIAIVGRKYLEEIESDASDTTKMPDTLILKKYNQSNIDLDNKVFGYIRHTYKTYFDPTLNILNLEKMQRSYAYYMLYLLYSDLTLAQETFNTYKSELNNNQYSETLKDGLSLLQLDFNEDGEADASEKKDSAGGTHFIR